jgi:hypothetical protein
VLVGQDLELDVPRLLEELLHVDLGLPKAASGLGLRDS